MGKQVQFYMSQLDASDFCKYLGSVSGASLIPYWVINFNTLDLVPDLANSSLTSSHFWIWNSKLSPTPKLNYIKEQRKWTIDDMHSEVIQFGLCHVDRGIMRKGRLWVDLSGLVGESGKERKKSAEFEKWYLCLVKWIKSEGKKLGPSLYALPDALRSGMTLS